MSETNRAFLRLTRRAEVADRSKLVETFVDVGALFTLLSSRDHQVIYGRRGTGKTHALLFLADSAASRGDIPVYVDLRTIGSTTGIYSDEALPVPERATRLLMDTLAAVHDGLLEHVVEVDDDSLNLATLGPALDSFAEAATEVEVLGAIETEEETGVHQETEESSHAGFEVTPRNIGITGTAGETTRSDSLERRLVRRTGEVRHRVHFGRVGAALRRISEQLGGRHIWILLDEWSVVPPRLQPYLADLLRRSVFPAQEVTVKIGAIEQRTQFQLPGDQGTYLGIELGADMSADLNLDDFMVFENDAARATDFFEQLLFRHYSAVADELEIRERFSTPARLVQGAFTQRPTFEEFVRAAEGVPRDAINILSLPAQRSGEAQISRDHIRAAAHSWFQRDKEAAVSANSQARALLHWVIDEVIAHRRARAFLLRTTEREELIEVLFDARVLHLLKKNISAHDEPGVRYDVYKIDYGCYVDLLTTARAPEGLLPADGEDPDQPRYVDVPPDDYRAIRRAILDLKAFDPERAPGAR